MNGNNGGAGSRGGHYYLTRTGGVRYGTPPSAQHSTASASSSHQHLANDHIQHAHSLTDQAHKQRQNGNHHLADALMGHVKTHQEQASYHMKRHEELMKKRG